MTGGTLTAQTDNSPAAAVSGVYVTGGTFKLSGGEINGCSYGLEVGVSGTFEMTGGKITGIINMGVYSSGTFTMTGGEISGCTTGIWLDDGTFELSGAPKIYDNFNDVRVIGNVKITVTGALRDGAEKAQIGIRLPNGYSGAFTEGYGLYNKVGNKVTEPYNYFFSDDPSYAVVLTDNGEAELVPAVATVKVGTQDVVKFGDFMKAWEYANANGSSAQAAEITLLSDVSVSKTVAVSSGKSVTLDLNGRTLTRTGRNGRVITVNGTFTLKDGQDGGMITGGYEGDSTSQCGGVYVSGTFIMESGKIYGNSAFSGSGGVYVEGGGRFKMTGGTISGNSTGTGTCGGVYVEDGGAFEIEGTPNITGNMKYTSQYNVYFAGSDGKFTVTGELQDGAKIGICRNRVVTTGYSDHNSDAPYLYFVPDYAGYAATLDENGEVLIAPAVATVGTGSDGGEIRFANINEAFDYANDEGGEASPATVTLLRNVQTSMPVSVSSESVITLDLNGKTLTKNDDENYENLFMYVFGKFTLDDSADGGKIVCTVNEDNGAFLPTGVVVTDGGEFEMNGGAIIGGGFGVLINDASFRMIYGEISGNAYYGVGVNGGSFEMLDGTVENNGCGVWVVDGEFRISGAPVVSGNTEMNVELYDAIITVTGTLTENAEIGVYATGTVVTGFTQDEKPEKFFFSDNPDYSCIYLSDKEKGDVVIDAHSEAYDEAVPPTCTEDGLTEGSHCSVCGNVLEEQQTDPSTGHAWGEWEVHRTSCSVEGYRIHTCANDPEHVEREEIPATEHSYAADFTVDTPATCTAEGSKSRHCENCDDRTDVTVIPATGHAWGEWTTTKEPTCTEAGEKTRVCGNDGKHVETEPIAAAGHAWGEWTTTKEPTCTEAGERTRVCGNDGKHVETEPIAATNHDFGEWTVTKAATYDEEGEERRVCKNDGSHVEKRAIPKLTKPSENPPDNPPDNPPEDNKPADNKPADNKPADGTEKTDWFDFTVLAVILAIIILSEVAYLVIRAVRKRNRKK